MTNRGAKDGGDKTTRSFGRDLFLGLIVPGAPIIVLPHPSNSGWVGVGMGLWALWLFGLRRIWIEALVRFAYGGRWSRLILFPLSAGDRESCADILYALTWMWLVVGALATAIGIWTLMRP